MRLERAELLAADLQTWAEQMIDAEPDVSNEDAGAVGAAVYHAMIAALVARGHFIEPDEPSAIHREFATEIARILPGVL